MHATLEKFGYGPGTVFEDEHWAVVVRPAQPTLGSMVLIAKRDIESFGALTAEEGAALPAMVARIEAALARVVTPERVNYLMLMMVDRHVHYHVVPRYAEPRNWGNHEFIDTGWPSVPALSPAVALDPAEIAQLRADLANGTTRGG
ncbi:HIT family protein [Glacieibacterium frigidum]|uniref:HIT family protein n=1 Tax=Glacieibacterium frigidum TaxID=2593303 RepID=A0A552UGU7_9SPHN|nr:HIT family protein [Glacieibacterium frigidum]TRW17411.1 HIT family protein [Glacieibacterium frigidum]